MQSLEATPRSRFLIPANTVCPPRAKVVAVARPMPVLVPVTTTMPILTLSPLIWGLGNYSLARIGANSFPFKDFVSPQGPVFRLRSWAQRGLPRADRGRLAIQLILCEATT